jgi:hypothetical protein
MTLWGTVRYGDPVSTMALNCLRPPSGEETVRTQQLPPFRQDCRGMVMDSALLIEYISLPPLCFPNIPDRSNVEVRKVHTRRVHRRIPAPVCLSSLRTPRTPCCRKPSAKFVFCDNEQSAGFKLLLPRIFPVPVRIQADFAVHANRILSLVALVF